MHITWEAASAGKKWECLFKIGICPNMYDWLVVYLPLWKNMKVSWDYDIPKIWKVIKLMFQTTNQVWTYDIHWYSKKKHVETLPLWGIATYTMASLILMMIPSPQQRVQGWNTWNMLKRKQCSSLGIVVPNIMYSNKVEHQQQVKLDTNQFRIVMLYLDVFGLVSICWWLPSGKRHLQLSHKSLFW